jgi:hypothetical protein
VVVVGRWLWERRDTPVAPPEPRRGEVLFEFCRARDHSRWLCELRDDGDEYGVMALSFAKTIGGRRGCLPSGCRDEKHSP